MNNNQLIAIFAIVGLFFVLKNNNPTNTSDKKSLLKSKFGDQQKLVLDQMQDGEIDVLYEYFVKNNRSTQVLDQMKQIGNKYNIFT